MKQNVRKWNLIAVRETHIQVAFSFQVSHHHKKHGVHAFSWVGTISQVQERARCRCILLQSFTKWCGESLYKLLKYNRPIVAMCTSRLKSSITIATLLRRDSLELPAAVMIAVKIDLIVSVRGLCFCICCNLHNPKSYETNAGMENSFSSSMVHGDQNVQ